MRLRQQAAARGYQLSVVSSQLVKERSQHTFYFDGPFRKSLIINGRQELQITSEQEMVLKFTGRAHRNLQEARKFAITLSTGSSAMFAPIEAADRRI
jgi:hypothetical protein